MECSRRSGISSASKQSSPTAMATKVMVDLARRCLQAGCIMTFPHVSASMCLVHIVDEGWTSSVICLPMAMKPLDVYVRAASFACATICNACDLMCV